MSEAPVHRLTVHYFAWVRERVGLAREELDVPPGMATVADLVAHLRARGAPFAEVFGRSKSIRVALNQTHVSLDTSLKDAREVAFFPPVTGG